MKFLVKDGADDQYLFAKDPVEVISAHTVDEVLTALERAEKLQADGFYLAGWISYEASPAFDKRHVVNSGSEDLPLVYFQAAKKVDRVSLDDLNFVKESISFAEITHTVSEEEYISSCSKVLDYIKEGDIYQVNYSFRCQFNLPVDPLVLFTIVEKQHPVPHSFFIDSGKWQVLSHSPELFLSKEGRHLESQPMKGTVKRAVDFSGDEKLREELTLDDKSRAENVMIVDLMRNDLSRICELNSVKVPDLFIATRYASLHQLTSTVTGVLKESVGFVDILKATFPAGSITGAPKIRSMEIISELEKDGRGLYTGSAGVLKPGGDFSFNVCIRTIVVKDQMATIGIGSGVVADSAQNLEWQECLLKSEFINFRRQHNEIFETMLWTSGEIIYLEDHLQRLKNSCEYFSVPYFEDEIRLIIDSQNLERQNYRLRLSIDVEGNPKLDSVPINKGWGKDKLKIVLSESKLNTKDPYLYHKTDCRGLYNKEFKLAQEKGYDEAIYLNEKGELCEGAISNIFLKVSGVWKTPSLKSGLLPGTWRKNKIDDLKAVETTLTVEDVKSAEAVMIGNSVRQGGEVVQIVSGLYEPRVDLFLMK